MGANSEDIALFSQYLAKTPAASLQDLLAFLTILEKPQSSSEVSANLAKDVKALVEGATKDSEVAKTPVFNEIVLKLSLLGDKELADDFAKLSPALQAIRGGISGAGAFGDGTGSQQNHGRNWENERQAFSDVQSLALNQGLDGTGFNQALSAEISGYGSRESLARQLEKKLIFSARQGVYRLKMDLAPEDLGRLDVELKVKNDQLTAHIKAETEEAYAALEKEIASLKASLAEQGLDMNLTLSFDGQNENNRHFAKSKANDLLNDNVAINVDPDDSSENSDYRDGGQLLDMVV
jgi:flagellar hook-length control protein FliK